MKVLAFQDPLPEMFGDVHDNIIRLFEHKERVKIAVARHLLQSQRSQGTDSVLDDGTNRRRYIWPGIVPYLVEPIRNELEDLGLTVRIYPDDREEAQQDD